MSAKPTNTDVSLYSRLRGGNIFIRDIFFDFFKVAEMLYRQARETIASNSTGMLQILMGELSSLPSNMFHCASFKNILLRKFLSALLKLSEKKKARKKKFDSRSILVW